MRKEILNNEILAAFCRELSLLLHAGIGVGDGLRLLEEDEPEGTLRRLLSNLADQVEEGQPLSAAMEESGVFPDYVRAMTETGERTGRLEEACLAMAENYDSRQRLSRQLRAALLYPAMLLVLMLVVIVVLLAKVLPVFDQVFRQLGGQLTGMAGGLLALGRFLDAAMPALCALLALAVLAVLLFSFNSGLRSWLTQRGEARQTGRGVGGQVARARTASALAMGLGAGLPMEEALDLAASFQTSAAARAQFEECRRRLEDGASLAEALREAAVFSPSDCRMLDLGVKSGTGDTVMARLAQRLETEATDAVEERTARVEPTLVIVTSILVGIILLSVMLPLLNIMSVL